MPDELVIDARTTDKISNLLTGRKHSITVNRNFQFNVIEMEDINFHFDSAVLLPDYGTEAPQPGTGDQNRVTGLAVIYACYKHSQSNEFQQKILVTGHTDKKGSDFYNLGLSQQRAENVFFLFTGDRAKWIESSNGKNQIEDIQQILKWISFNFRYDCDPGEKTNKMNSETKIAIEKFQKRYNQEFIDLKTHQSKFSRNFIRIDEDGKMGRETWGAFFDMYVLELLIVMGINEAGLNEIHSKLSFVKKSPGTPPPVVGCGEHFPKSGSTSEQENPVDRRVELLFFDEGEEPVLKCHPAKLICKHKQCDLFNTQNVYKPVPVQVNPLPLPSGVAVRAHLKFIYKTPEGGERPFPKGFPFVLKFGDTTTEQKKIESDDGQVFLQILREKKSFTIEFKFQETNFVAIPADESSGDEIIPESNAKEKIKNNFRVFSLPLEWDLKISDWSLSPAVSNFDDTTKEFKNLDDLSVENIGSEASPVGMQLNPHWQFLKFVYFDRWIKEKLSLLPLVIEGFSSVSDTKPSVQSNWQTADEGCQCLPWIIRSPAKPDTSSLIRIRTAENTFIETTGSSSNFSRKYITKNLTASTDPGLNEGTSVNKDFNKAEAERLAFYDLPKLWKSNKYFTQLSAGKGNPPSKVGKFEDLVTEVTANDKPLILSLDDIVLTDKDLNPIGWIPDNKTRNRTAIFCNSFSRSGPSSSNLSSEGLYKPDGRAFIGGPSPNTFNGNNLGYFTQLPQDEKTRNYISDYPDWTRLVITQGNFFDVFDRRTVEGKGDVVGARAGVRVVDVFGSATTFVPPGTNRPRVPQPVKTNFCEVQPLFEQDHVIYINIGRYDMIRLRCCDISSDASTEISICLLYLRLFFNFNSNITPSFNANAVKANLTGATARQWRETAIMNLVKRWNGPDSTTGISPTTLNSGPAEILPGDSSVKYQGKVVWFSQNLPNNISHFEIGIFTDSTTPGGVRAFMQARNGTGVLDTSDNVSKASGWFTFAHEVGHGASLVDEYVEPTAFPQGLPGVWLDSFDCNSPGSPFDIDEVSMMRSNRTVRARHYWHVAEWFRKLDKQGSTSPEYKVKHGRFEYTLKHHNDEPVKNYIGWPLNDQRNQTLGDHGKFDGYLYPFGNDRYSVTILKDLTGSSNSFDGILVILIKMEFDFHINTTSTIHNFLNDIHSRINLRFNFKYGVKGNFSGQTFNNCLLHFSPRYYSSQYSSKKPSDNSEHFIIKMKASGTPNWDTGLIFVNEHKLFFPINAPASFANFFGNMIGLANGTLFNAASYKPAARKLIPNADVFTF